MTAKFYAILTNQGAARLANAAALGTKLNLTQMAVGDANGALPTPDATQTRLVNQKRIAPINMLSVDPDNDSQIIAEQIIPETEGGFWIREIGLFDDSGVLIAVANCPETYKPQLQEGSGRTQTIRMVLIVSSTAAVTLKIDPGVVLATRKYVDDKVIEVKAYADGLMKKHVEAANPHTQYPLIANALKEMVEAGLVQDVLKNLGLGAGSALPVGVPVPWPTETPPAGWLKCNGAAFDKAKYPGLALAYPSGKLPDLRGEFIRGWDDGRGVDLSRNIFSPQEHALQVHNHFLPTQTGTGSSAWTIPDSIFIASDPNEFPSDGNFVAAVTLITPDGYMGNVGNMANETRPRNLAFNYIVRAA